MAKKQKIDNKPQSSTEPKRAKSQTSGKKQKKTDGKQSSPKRSTPKNSFGDRAGKSSRTEKRRGSATDNEIASSWGEYREEYQTYKQSTTPKNTKRTADEWLDAYFSSFNDSATDDLPVGSTTEKQSKPKRTTDKTQRGESGKQKNTREKKESPRTKQRSKSEPVYTEDDKNGKLRIIPLGGLNEIGKNMTAIEYGEDIIVVDCGLGFPEEDMPGIDLVIPDTTYLEQNSDRLRGIVLTHGHEDHIGALPYVLRNINPPVYGTKLTLGIVKNKLKEVTLPHNPKLNCVRAGDVVRLGKISVEFIHVNHSIADACALAIRTPIGTVLHSGDFKLDLSPIDGEIMDITRLGEIGKEGVLMLMCESTNAERPGTTPSEKKVGASLEYIFTVQKEKRIVISTFSSNVHRVQQIIDVAARHKRKVAITGRSMLNIVGAAVELGYMNVPEGVLIDISEIKRYSPHEVTLITTGSQGEPMSALYRMAFGEHRDVRLGAGDVVVLSSSPIPGNEKLINRIVNELCKLGVEVIRDAAVEVHVSGHACQEEIKLLYALTKPKYYMPVHGEYKHLSANRELALYMGMEPNNIFISDIGRVLEIDRHGVKWGESVPAGRVLIDGSGVGDVGNIVLRDRILLSQDGLIVVTATVSSDGGYVMSGPDIVSRGFVYVRESEDLMEELRSIALRSMMSCLGGHGSTDWFKIKNKVKDDMAKYIYSKTKRRPMIIPMIMNV